MRTATVRARSPCRGYSRIGIATPRVPLEDDAMKPTDAGEDDGTRSEPGVAPLAAARQEEEAATLPAVGIGSERETVPGFELGPRGSGTLPLIQVFQLPQ